MSQSGSVNAAASNPEIPIDFVTDSGTATASGNVINVNGLGLTATAGAGNTITITSNATATTFTANSGSATPSANNLNVIGTGSTTTTGSGSTLTASLTGLTNHSVLVGAGTATITKVGPSTNSGQVLQSGGLSADPVFSTATYPSTTSVNQLLYSSSNNIVSQIATDVNGLLVTSSAGVPSILAGPAATGKVLQSNAAAAPSFSTATFPSTATGTGTILRADGTNWVASTSTYPNTNAVSTLLYASSANVMAALPTATNGILVTDNSSVPSILGGPGAAGKVLQSNTAAAPSYSTATYPATATSTGTILRADGTNWVATTATYPNVATGTNTVLKANGTNWVASTETYAAPGTSGNIMTSDGTNWTSVSYSGFTYVLKNITSAQIKALHATPIQVVAAPASGKVIQIVGPVYGKFNYGGSNVFVAGAAQTLVLAYGTGTTQDTACTNAILVGTTSSYLTSLPAATTGALNTYEALAVNLYNPVATEITGNAGNNNTFTVSFLYCTITLT